VNDLISKPVPRTLWHYTSFEGFRKIVGSQKIWATEYRFLNDREEFAHAKKLAEEVIEDEPDVDDGLSTKSILRGAVHGAFNTGPLRDDRMRIFVASFSEQGDQRSQWRAYANNSSGVAIGFDLQGLRPGSSPPPSEQTAVTFAPCRYKNDEKRALLKAVINHWQCGLREFWEPFIVKARETMSQAKRTDPQFIWQMIAGSANEQQEVLRNCQNVLQFDLLRVAPLLKNAGFHEEEEWRLVLPVQSSRFPTQHPIEFRSTADAVVPYIAYPLKGAENEAPIPCNDLIVGPASHESAAFGVDVFLEANGIRVLAQRSKVSYRASAR
jgi:hypothetical protein